MDRLVPGETNSPSPSPSLAGNSFLRQRLRELLRIEGRQIIQWLAELHFACLSAASSLSSRDQ